MADLILTVLERVLAVLRQLNTPSGVMGGIAVSLRILDRADVSALLRANETILDREYLHTWATRLGVDADLESIWREAFPGREGSGGTPRVKERD